MALVVRINSPGGSVSSADQIWRELSLVRKPIVASMGDMAASGGYYVAAPADLHPGRADHPHRLHRRRAPIAPDRRA